MFSISIESQRSRSRVAVGTITVGAFAERFEAPLDYWSREAYEAHWREAVNRIVGGHKRSALITSMIEPFNATFIVWWPMWRVGPRVFFQNHLLFMDRFRGDRAFLFPYRHVRPRIDHRRGQPRPSEWSTSVTSLARFLQLPSRLPNPGMQRTRYARR
jgi:hypothetical protein